MNLTIDQAKLALIEGKRITHRSFMAGEYLVQKDDELYDEIGQPLNYNEFFNYRSNKPMWGIGWSIVDAS